MVTERPLMVVNDVPAARIARSSAEILHSVDLEALEAVCESIQRQDNALRDATNLDDVREAVRSLAGSTAALAWEVRNLTAGIRAGRVEVLPED